MTAALALEFLEAIYAGKPAGSWIAISHKNGRGFHTDFVDSAAAALPLVVGTVDVYHRVTPLRERPPKGERGTAELSACLPGVWADLDIIGTPDNKGEPKTEGFASIEAATAAATAVHPPTWLIDSGGGLHPYVLFSEPLLIETPDDLRRAQALELRYLQALRAHADGADMDSVQDLARVLRPVGSANGKGPQPRPVVALHSGERVELGDVEQLLPALAEDEPKAKKKATNNGNKKANKQTKQTASGKKNAEKLVAEHSSLAEALSGKRKYGDGSDSDRDHYLCCQAIRLGLDHGDVLEQLLWFAGAERKTNPADYIERTIRKARAEQAPPDGALSREQRLNEITVGLGLSGDPVRHGQIHGLDVGSGAGVVVLTRESGAVVRFARYSHLFDLRAWTRTVRHYNGGAAMGTPTQAMIDRFASHIRAVCGVTVQDPAAEARQWLYDFDYEVGDTVPVDATPRWDQLKKARDRAVKLTSDAGPKVSVAGKAVALLDPDGNTWIPAGPLLAHIVDRVDATELRSRMAEAGIERREVEKRRPGVPHNQRKKEDRIRGAFYLLPPDPPDQEGDQ